MEILVGRASASSIELAARSTPTNKDDGGPVSATDAVRIAMETADVQEVAKEYAARLALRNPVAVTQEVLDALAANLTAIRELVFDNIVEHTPSPVMDALGQEIMSCASSLRSLHRLVGSDPAEADALSVSCAELLIAIGAVENNFPNEDESDEDMDKIDDMPFGTEHSFTFGGVFDSTLFYTDPRFLTTPQSAVAVQARVLALSDDRFNLEDATKFVADLIASGKNTNDIVLLAVKFDDGVVDYFASDAVRGRCRIFPVVVLDEENFYDLCEDDVGVNPYHGEDFIEALFGESNDQHSRYFDRVHLMHDYPGIGPDGELAEKTVQEKAPENTPNGSFKQAENRLAHRGQTAVYSTVEESAHVNVAATAAAISPVYSQQSHATPAPSYGSGYSSDSCGSSSSYDSSSSSSCSAGGGE